MVRLILMYNCLAEFFRLDKCLKILGTWFFQLYDFYLNLNSTTFKLIRGFPLGHGPGNN